MTTGASSGAGRMRKLISAVSPPAVIQRVLLVQTFTYSLGTGFYLAGSIVFFSVYVELSAAQISLGLSAAALVTLIAKIPFGMLADRLGGKRSWTVGALGQAVLFGCYPLVTGFWAFLPVVCLAALAATFGQSGRSRYLGEVVPRGERVKVNAYLRSVVNVGLALGTAAAGLLVTVQSRRVIAMIILVNAASFLLDVVLLAFFIKPAPAASSPAKTAPSGRAALRDRPFVALSVINGIFMSSDLILTVLLPLWILQVTDGPRSMISVLLLINMFMVTFLQVWASSGSDDVAQAARRQRLAGFVIALACIIVPVSAYTNGALTWVTLVVGVVVLTLGELYSSAAAWGLGYGLSPAERRGEYLAVYGWGGSVGEIVGPATLTYVALTIIPGGWLMVSVLFVAGALLTGPVVERVIRSRSDERPADDGPEAAREALSNS